MKKLNEQATKIFCRLLKKLNGKDYLQLKQDGFMPLTLEKLQSNILTPSGKGITYSLSHNYIHNGDLIRDPEMVFIVVDNRTDQRDFKAIEIYPQMYQQDNTGLFEESITIENDTIKSFIKAWQYSHCNFANQWLKNIRQQGFLK